MEITTSGLLPLILLLSTFTSAKYAPATKECQQPDFTVDELFNLTERFITSLIYPANVAQAKSLNSTLLAEDVIGRVDITGLFPGRELSTEYLYGLFANFTPTPDSFNFLGTPINTNLEFNMWVTYNSAGEVSQYDISARRVDRTFDYVLNATMAAINATSPVQVLQFLTGVLAKSVCSTAHTYCNGTNQQYPDEEQCINFLETQIRFGKAYEFDANTPICRMLHQEMVPFRPEVHCPHIEPSGGNFCVDSQTYPETVLEPAFTVAPFVPYGWQNPDPTIAAE